MIAYPIEWGSIGSDAYLSRVESIIDKVIKNIPCSALSLSGGVDSSLLLYFMSKHNSQVRAYTIGSSEGHPDVLSAKKLCKHFDNVTHMVHIPKLGVEVAEGDLTGDEAVREFYKFVGNFEESIVAGDGIDEFACGYYDHQRHPTEETYHKHIRKLVPLHLEPLNRNSGNVMVYLPYLNDELLWVLLSIPIADKVDSIDRKKIIMSIAKDKLPNFIVTRRKYGFCDALSKLEGEER